MGRQLNLRSMYFRLSIRKPFFSKKVEMQWQRLPREVVELLSLVVFKN